MESSEDASTRVGKQQVVLGTVMIEKIAGALGGAVTLKKPGQELCRDESCAQ